MKNILSRTWVGNSEKKRPNPFPANWQTQIFGYKMVKLSCTKNLDQKASERNFWRVDKKRKYRLINQFGRRLSDGGLLVFSRVIILYPKIGIYI